jgi:hypothetical protein
MNTINTSLCMLYLKYLKLSQRNGRITHRDTGMLISLSGNKASTIIIGLFSTIIKFDICK